MKKREAIVTMELGTQARADVYLSTEVEAALAEKDEEIARLSKENLLLRGNSTWCVACAEMFEGDTSVEELQRHTTVCEKHPLGAALRQLATAQAEIAQLHAILATNKAIEEST